MQPRRAQRWPLRASSRSAAAVVVGALALGCAGSYRLDGQPAAERPAEDILRLRWHRQLAHPEVFDWRPQEWASAAFGRDGTVYVGSSARRFVALRGDGKLLWSIRTAGAICSRPLYHAESDTVFFGADDGNLYAVHAGQGRVLWRYATQGPVVRAPVYWEGLLLVSSSENRIYGIDAATGRWRWQYDREAPEGFTIQGHAGVLIHDNVAFTGFSDGVVVALRPSSGEVIWTRSLAGNRSRFVDVDATPVAVGDMVVTASYASGVYALAPDTGSVHWHFPVEGASTVAAGRRRVYFTAPQKGLVALDLLGRELWQQAMPRGVPSPPLVIGSYLLVTGTESGLFVASAASGRLLQYFDPGHGISGRPAVGGRTAVVLSNHGRLFAFRIR